MADSSSKRMDDMEQALVTILHKTHEYGRESQKYSRELKNSYGDMTERLIEKLGELGGTLSTSYERNKPINVAGVYKDMINQISQVNESIKSKPVPVWNWPQYASVGVRNKNFANVNPATEENQNYATGYSAYKITLVGTVCYQAYATVGSLYASLVWQASKIDFTDLTNIQTTWANGNQDFTNPATDLTALSYS